MIISMVIELDMIIDNDDNDVGKRTAIAILGLMVILNIITVIWW